MMPETDLRSIDPAAHGPAENPDAITRKERSEQRLARLAGLLFLLTFATSIPAFFVFYAPALSDPRFVLGGTFSRSVAFGAILEMVLIAANIATALALYPTLRRSSAILAPAFIAARIVESGFIAVGVVALMALNTLRSNAASLDPGDLLPVAAALLAVHDWTFRLGPGVVVGVGNGLILGWMMWKTRLVPRALSWLGLVGGPSLLVAGVTVMLAGIEAGGTVQIMATMPEFFWELFLGFWLLIRGFDPTALRRTCQG